MQRSVIIKFSVRKEEEEGVRGAGSFPTATRNSFCRDSKEIS